MSKAAGKAFSDGIPCTTRPQKVSRDLIKVLLYVMRCRAADIRLGRGPLQVVLIDDQGNEHLLPGSRKAIKHIAAMLRGSCPRFRDRNGCDLQSAVTFVISASINVPGGRLIRAARQLIRAIAPGHWAIILLHKDTDHTHVHVTISTYSPTGVRLHITRRQLLSLYRAEYTDQFVDPTSANKVRWRHAKAAVRLVDLLLVKKPAVLLESGRLAISKGDENKLPTEVTFDGATFPVPLLDDLVARVLAEKPLAEDEQEAKGARAIAIATKQRLARLIADGETLDRLIQAQVVKPAGWDAAGAVTKVEFEGLRFGTSSLEGFVATQRKSRAYLKQAKGEAIQRGYERLQEQGIAHFLSALVRTQKLQAARDKIAGAYKRHVR